jgi:hypothetical protein
MMVRNYPFKRNKFLLNRHPVEGIGIQGGIKLMCFGEKEESGRKRC